MTERHFFAIFTLLLFGAWVQYGLPALGNEDPNAMVSSAAWALGIAIGAFLFPDNDR